MARETKKIIVDIEALFDMRLGVLITLLGAEAAFEATKDASYYTRTYQDITTPAGPLTKEIYRKVLNKDPAAIWQVSMRTKIYEFIVSRCAKVREGSFRSPIHADPEICINIHGYSLTEKEESSLIAGMRDLTGALYDVSTLDMGDSELSPAWLKAHARALIMYDPVNWVNTNSSALIKSAPNIDFTVFAPRLLENNDHLEEVKKAKATYSGDVFNLFELTCSQCFQLSLLPVSAFCADTPANTDSFLEA